MIRSKSKSKKKINNYKKNTNTKKINTKKINTKKINTKKINNIYYYLVKSTYYNDKIVNNAFKIRSNWRLFNILHPQKKNPDFLFTDSKYLLDRKLWKYKPTLQNKFDAIHSNLTSKDTLYTTINKNINKYPELEKYIINNINIDFNDFITHDKINNKINYKINYNKLDDYKHLFSISMNKDSKDSNNYKKWIFKPVGGFRGKGIKLFVSFNEFKSACKDILQYIVKSRLNTQYDINKNNIRYKGDKIDDTLKLYNRWVLQEYIENTFLYPNITSGKKIHIRPYFLYYMLNNKANGYILDSCGVGISKEEYKNSDFKNPDIHDTHGANNTEGITFPEYFKNIMTPTQIKYIFSQLIELFGILKILCTTQCYPEVKYCYEIFGADILILPNLKLKLMEVNTNIAIIPYSMYCKTHLHDKLFNGIMAVVVDKIFKPSILDKNKIDKNKNHFITV